jgi:hypothetical protein
MTDLSTINIRSPICHEDKIGIYSAFLTADRHIISRNPRAWLGFYLPWLSFGLKVQISKKFRGT